MTTHISARLAWHDSGWNGHICREPKCNTYCIGQNSYQRPLIVEQRDLTWEESAKGKPIHLLNNVPPCIHSVNAFGANELEAFAQPPTWFRDSTETKRWKLLPYTVSTWPYEEMYKDEVTNSSTDGGPHYDPVRRRQAAKAFYDALEPAQSLIFYYANFSNPFSENDQHYYVVAGVSRIKRISDELLWDKQSPGMAQRYGPNPWLRDITSNYPDEGLRIPYDAYMDRPNVLERILFVPENSRNFKYAARHISDDGALGLIERLSEIVGVLQEIGDTHENWEARQTWLASLMAELWTHRGLYPGLLRVWDYLKFSEAIPFTMEQAPKRGEQTVRQELFDLVQGKRESVAGLKLDAKRVEAVRKQWKKLEPDKQTLLRDTLPRFDLRTEQIAAMIEEPQTVSLYATHTEIAANPYILAEQYIGNGPDDQVTFSQIDHGMFPSPELGKAPELEPDDWQRLRVLCVEQLQRAAQHTFLPADTILEGLNHKLGFMPEWKRTQFTSHSLEIDKGSLGQALTYRNEGNQLYLYLRTIFEDERSIEAILRDMANRPDIKLQSPVTEGHWKAYLYDSENALAKAHPSEYEAAINQQLMVCQQIFRRPLSVLCGAAGTGKTTVVEKIIKAIEKGHGAGTAFKLLAPTGKAADRLRERTGKDASTIHSFLAERGWLNDNLTFKRVGGKRESNVTTFIIDESSMLDLPLLATLFRAINWNAVQRLIFVGDPNQLPPIGTGKVFADLIDWLKQELPEHVGELTTNMRLLENQLTKKGTGIPKLASLYIRRDLADIKDHAQEVREEQLLAQVQEGGDIDGDLRILYWHSSDELEKLLVETIVADMEKDTGQKLDPARPDKLWDTCWQALGSDKKPEKTQVLSPYRGEPFGIDNLNLVLQRHKNNWMLENKGELGGVTYNDKVIQILNRPKSNPIWGWNTETKKNERIEVYNGEIGLTKVHGFDHNKWTWAQFRLARFQVVFSRKQKQWVSYTSESEVESNLELAYAISVHKAQGSEFQRVYFVLPKHKLSLLSRELFYTGLTRAQTHCTLLVEEDIAPILSVRRLENSHLARINSSLFRFRPVPAEFQTMRDWYKEGKIHRTLTAQMVRSKSEVIIANMLADHDIPFEYEMPLRADDGTFYLPDFTVHLRGETWYWEHLGLLSNEGYRKHWVQKQAWYTKHGFADQLITTTEEGGFDSPKVMAILKDRLGVSS